MARIKQLNKMNMQNTRIGEEVNHYKYGKGMVTNVTKRTVTVTYENGVVIKTTYKY
jgi:hypothetical protein